MPGVVRAEAPMQFFQLADGEYFVLVNEHGIPGTCILQRMPPDEFRFNALRMERVQGHLAPVAQIFVCIPPEHTVLLVWEKNEEVAA